jgi:Cytochrome C oxidase, cbb3-type, subunit III
MNSLPLQLPPHPQPLSPWERVAVRPGEGAMELSTRFMAMPRNWMASLHCCLILLMLGATVGCRQDMHDQPKVESLEASTFFPDGRASRPLVPGTVPRGQLREDTHLYEGRVGGKPAETFPFPIDLKTLERGRQRYNIYCTPCHDRVGNGDGMVVRRGFRRPPSYHIERLRQAPPGYLYDVITNGFGAMQDYAAQIPVRDRWAIVAYVRALQLSQNAALSDVPETERQGLPSGESKQ